MKVYIVAYTGGVHMFPAHNKFYRSKEAAQKKCDQMNQGRSANNQVVVLCADNWHKE